MQATQKRCEDAGFFKYLSKPLNIQSLEITLRNVHEHRYPRPNGIPPTDGPGGDQADGVNAVHDIDVPTVG